MRKGVSILFAAVMMFSGAHFTIATHYCGGMVAATKVSLSGKLASCGMENTEDNCTSPEKHLKTHCCDNTVVTIGILNNFTAPVSIQDESNQNNFQIFYLQTGASFHNITYSTHLNTDKGPPGSFSASAVNLNFICAFRI